jgi:hypothetical protein
MSQTISNESDVYEQVQQDHDTFVGDASTSLSLRGASEVFLFEGDTVQAEGALTARAGLGLGGSGLGAADFFAGWETGVSTGSVFTFDAVHDGFAVGFGPLPERAEPACVEEGGAAEAVFEGE